MDRTKQQPEPADGAAVCDDAQQVQNTKDKAVAYPSFGADRVIVREYDIASLEDSPDNHFHQMEGEKWDEFVGSIREFGVVSPLIIRAKAGSSGRYEILAGHNRRNGAAEAGLQKVPCIALDVDDVDASVLIGITNKQRESVSDLEWGWTYRTTLEALKQQRASDRRNAGERSIDLVARKFGVDRKTVLRKIRLTYLVPQLYQLGKQKGYPQKMMISLSYLPPAVQINVVQAAVIEEITLTEQSVKALCGAAEESDPTINDVIRICREHGGAAGRLRSSRPVRYEVPEALFPPELTQKQRQNYVTAALCYIREHGVDLAIP